MRYFLDPIDFYDEDTNNGDRNSSLVDREKKSIEIIINLFQTNNNKSLKILDIGCGGGLFLSVLSNELMENCLLYGIDYSEFQLEQAKEKLHNASFKRANIDNGIPYEDATFDVIYAGQLIEHLYNPDFFVREVNRVLKNNGVFILTTPNLNGWLSRLVFLLGIYPIFYETSTEDARFGFGLLKNIKKQSVPVGHIRVMNVDAIKSLLNKNHFFVLGITGSPFERFSGIIEILDKLFIFIPSLSSQLVVWAQKK